MKKLICVMYFIATCFACTGISFDTDGGFISARTIEYGDGDLHSRLIISPRNKVYQSLLPNTKELGIKWRAKYGFVGISVMDERFIAEGINEAGLNAGFFYFPHYGSLEKYNKKYQKSSIVDMQFITYLLSNFKDIAEIKKNINKIHIVNIGYDELQNPFPTAHYRISDASGSSVVLELTNGGKINFYDNKVGVVTNSPDYEWHLKNLNNYINLDPSNAKNYEFNGQKIFSFGAGTAFLGLPGDITPPSRFVRAFFMLKDMPRPKNAEQGVKIAFHILNNFDIPIWLEYPKSHQEYIPEGLLSATQWTSVADLKNKKFYYKTMNESKIKMIELKSIEFDKTSFISVPVDKF